METRVVGERFEESVKKIQGYTLAADPSVHISLHITLIIAPYQAGARTGDVERCDLRVDISAYRVVTSLRACHKHEIKQLLEQ